MSTVMRYKDGFWPNLLALTYVATGYTGGLLMMLSSALWLNMIGIFVFAHAMIIAAYMIHECAHNTIFKNNRYHYYLGEILMWICGASYSNYEDIRNKHFRHHVDRADVVSFDYREKVKQYPVLLKVIEFLEWFYIPAMEIVMHALVIVLPFVKANRKQRRKRVIMFLVLRGAFFLYLASISVYVLVYYSLAYMMFLTVLRFMDAHQHTYDISDTLDQPRGEQVQQYDREFEHHNTFSNLISTRHPWLNLLVLNFSYHNVHHDFPIKPWYQLRATHEANYGYADHQVLPFWQLLRSYHRFRRQRVINADEINLNVQDDPANFVGVDGVSFLTTH